MAGAGRGPLVQGCLRAIARSGRKGFIYAVEKNPNAFVTFVSSGDVSLLQMLTFYFRLQERKANEWSSEEVKLVFGDMRSIELEENCDILVSELLGSFGDNELSPECLDGAMRFLKRSVIHL